MSDDDFRVENDTHLKWAVYHLSVMEAALAALHKQLGATDPRLFRAAAPAYEQRIALLRRAIKTESTKQW